MFYNFDELFVYLDIIRPQVLTILHWDPDAELVKLRLLVRVETAVLEHCIILFKVGKETVSHIFTLFCYYLLIA